MRVFKKTQKHARAHKILAARHCRPCEICLQVSIDCVPADSGSYKVKCKPCNGKSHPPCYHKFWLEQSLVAKWDGLVSQGKAHIVADVMVYGSSAVFGHPQYDKGMTQGAEYEEVARHGTGQPATTTTPNPPSGPKQTVAEAGLATSQMRPGPQRLVPSQGNINLAYRSVDIAKGTDAEAALERISTAAKGLVERFGINNRSEEESKEEACVRGRAPETWVWW
ncbi:uncharacterized protein UHOD_11818 [Ustilago sp. UG-2017b]|nr:uncharacterized protein UHOD_11818 [Ustilago sp. UG-2017b]